MHILTLDWAYWNVSKLNNKLRYIVDSSFWVLHGCLLQWPATVCLLFSLIWMGHQFTKEHCIDSLDSLPQWVFRKFRESEGDGESAIVRNCTIVSGGMCLPLGPRNVLAANKTLARTEKRMNLNNTTKFCF